VKQSQPMKFRAQRGLLYHYWGVAFGKLTVKVKVIQMKVVEGHAAVWAGVNAGDNVSWVQGGIAQSKGEGVPEAYIERHQFNDMPRYTAFPLPAGKEMGTAVTVKLVRTSYKHWKCVISWDNEVHESQPVYIPQGKTIDACLEIWGHCSALVTINGKQVKGSANQ
jgi:hypothetical protein